MNCTLFGLYLREADDPLLWCADGPLGRPVEACPLERVADRVRGGRVLVWVPGDVVTQIQVNTPLRASRKLREALPYLLEEDLAGTYEDTHLAWDREGDGVRVGMVSRESMQHWRDAIEPLGGVVARLAPDDGMLPAGRDGVLLRPDGFSARLGDGRHFAGSLDALPGWLDLALGEEAGDTEEPREIALYSLVPMEPPSMEGDGWRLIPMALPSLEEAGRSALELRCGDFAPASASGVFWRAWSPAVAVLGLWVLVTWLVAIYETRELRMEWTAQRTAAESLYRTIFPDAQVVELPRAQMARRLQTLRAADDLRSGDLIALLQKVHAPLRAHAVGRVERIEYDGDKVRFVILGADARVLRDAFSGVTGWRVEVTKRAAAGALELAFFREVRNEPPA